MTAPDSEPGGPVPQTPWDFPLWGREQKGRRTYDRPPTLKASALFTIRRSGCVPAEPYPPNRTNRVAPGARLCYAFHNFQHANGGVQAQNKNRFYILARPFCCPAHGERLSILVTAIDQALIFMKRESYFIEFLAVFVT